MSKITVTPDELSRIVFPLQNRARDIGLSTQERINLFNNVEVVEKSNKFVSEMSAVFKKYGVNFVFGKPDDEQPRVMIEGPNVFFEDMRELNIKIREDNEG